MPLLFQSTQASGTITNVPTTKPIKQVFKPVIGRRKESRYDEGKKRKIIVP